jgi:hypothetical protein
MRSVLGKWLSRSAVAVAAIFLLVPVYNSLRGVPSLLLHYHSMKMTLLAISERCIAPAHVHARAIQQ